MEKARHGTDMVQASVFERVRIYSYTHWCITEKKETHQSLLRLRKSSVRQRREESEITSKVVEAIPESFYA